MRKVIEKFYDWLFLDEKTNKEDIPYGNKAFMFWFSIVAFATVIFFIARDVLGNIIA